MITVCEQFAQVLLADCGDWLIVAESTSSAAFLALSGWWPKAPDSETIWNILATLFAALMAGGAAIFAARWAARSTMKSARDLQDRERRLEGQSVAALLSADLHRKLVMLALLLQKPEAERINELATMDTNTKVVLEASRCFRY